MEDKAVRGAPWSLLTYGSTRAILLLNTVVLARILTPEDFGVVALATLSIGVFGFLGELGLGSAFTVRQDLDRDQQGTVLSLMLAAGGVTAAVVAALSPLTASLFDEPRLSPVVAVLSLSLFVNGFTWFYEQVLMRELEFRRRFVALLAQALTTLVVAVSAAVAGAGVWSIVAGQLAGMVVQGAAQLRLAPYRVRLRWDPPTAKGMIRAGRGFMALGGLTFVRQNLDYFAVARFLGSRPLGYYSMGYRLADLPSAAVAGPIAKVTFPAFARMRSRSEEVHQPFLASTRLVALATVPMGVGLSACADPFVEAIFGRRWEPMTPVLVALGLWAVVRPLQVSYGWFLNATERPGTSAALTAISIGLLLPGTVIAARHGVEAVAWVVVGEAAITFVLYAGAVARNGVPARAQLGSIAPVVVAGVPAWLTGWAVAEATHDLPAGLSLGASVVAVIVTYVAAVAVVAPSALRGTAAVARRTLRRGDDPATGSVDPVTGMPQQTDLPV